MLIDKTRDFLKVYRNSKLATFGLVILISSCAVSLLAPVISPYDPYELSTQQFLPPCSEHLLGTDNFGRDILSRVIWGTRVSLLFGLGVAGISLVIGVIVGACSGYLGGFIDDLLSRFVEIYLMIPTLILIVVVTSIFGTNILFTMFVVGLALWPSNARITRAQVLTLKSRAFVQASISAGVSHRRIMFSHILPNGIYPVVVNSTLQMGRAIITEANLSFLGLGDVNQVSWGQVLHVAQFYVKTAWWMAVFPGLAIMMLVLSFSLFGDGINLVTNPRLRERKSFQI